MALGDFAAQESTDLPEWGPHGGITGNTSSRERSQKYSVNRFWYRQNAELSGEIYV